MKTPLSHSRKEVFRLWFEYLRVAHNSQRREVQEALERSAPFYTPWGNVRDIKFDVWWKQKGRLFEQRYVVRRLKAGELPTDPNALIVEIPLIQSKNDLIKGVLEIITDEFDRLSEGSVKQKSRKLPTSQFQLTGGAEPKVEPLRDMLNVYRDVHLNNPRLRGKRLLAAVEEYYLGGKREPLRLPKSGTIGKKMDYVLRNLRRYIEKAEQITLNVAKGEFPGKY